MLRLFEGWSSYTLETSGRILRGVNTLTLWYEQAALLKLGADEVWFL
jgi:hypothetical protein